ncbi:Rtf2 RING-finger-domain-containing protein [Xylariaceae sp. FL0016]|nr:Rtf2 RING-finger-domain-containing protein [Xylariaceae sp. FL0016]
MGNDGGSIPKRRELVKNAARTPTTSELKATVLENLTHLWTFCPLSSEPLEPSTTVSDAHGRLYAYESILQCLLPSPSSAIPEAQEAEFARAGISSLKDVVKLKFSLRKDDDGKEVRACPVSMKELGASTKAVYLVPCGHVFAEVAMKEITPLSSGDTAASETDRTCPECSEPFLERDAIPILPAEAADIEKCTKRIEELKSLGLTHSLKKDKSAGKKKRKAGHDDPSQRKGTVGKDKEKVKDDISSRINNSMTASLTAKVLAEQEERNKRRKIQAVR